MKENLGVKLCFFQKHHDSDAIQKDPIIIIIEEDVLCRDVPNYHIPPAAKDDSI